MPAPKQPSKPLMGLASLPDIKFQKTEIDSVVGEAAKSVAGKMGIAVDKLPDQVMEAIKTAATSAMNTRTKALIQRDVDMAVKETVLQGVKPLDMLDARVNAAKEGIAHITQDAKVDAVLADTAKLLWKKFQALKTAGFTDPQAFDLVLAEVQGRASRNR